MWDGDRLRLSEVGVNENTPNPRVACRWSLNFLTPTELDKS